MGTVVLVLLSAGLDVVGPPEQWHALRVPPELMRA